jgi:hypothetical protein
MDLIQVIFYRLFNILLDILHFIGIKVTMPLYAYDSTECAREFESVTVFKGTYKQVPYTASDNLYLGS